MNKKSNKSVFALLIVGIGIGLFVLVGITIANFLGIKDLTSIFPFIPVWLFISVGIILLLVFPATFLTGIYYLNSDRGKGQLSGLRTNGIYKYTRNPMYIGNSMTVIGIGLIMLNTGVIIGGLLWFSFTFTQAKKEEKELFKRFGKKYQEYKSTTPMFIPNLSLIIRNIINAVQSNF